MNQITVMHVTQAEFMQSCTRLKGSVFTREQVEDWFKVVRGALQSVVQATPTYWDDYAFMFVDGTVLSNKAVIDKVCDVLGVV